MDPSEFDRVCIAEPSQHLPRASSGSKLQQTKRNFAENINSWKYIE